VTSCCVIILHKQQGQTALSIAQKLGYIGVVETLKVVTEPSIPTNVASGAEEKYRVVAPETMQETFMSDSEDEGGKLCILYFKTLCSMLIAF
jgi:ankyrin